MGGEAELGGVLLERDRELERIGRRLKQAEKGQGSTLVVEGPAGIGKTALLAAARDAAKSKGLRVLRARGAELEREFAFGVVRQLVEPALAGASEAERASLLDGAPGVAARLLALPGLAEPAPGAPPLAPDPSFAALHGLYWLCANLAAERPLALVVDDAQWADGASLRFLAFLLPRLEELPVAVLMAARPAEAGASEYLLAGLTMDPGTDVVSLRPLTTGGVARLVAVGLGAEPDEHFAAACREVTGGTPFLVHTLVEALREERISPVAASAGRVKGVATDTLGRWATRRLSQLGPDAARLARAVAILERAEPPDAARLAGLATGQAARAAELLVRAGVLVQPPLAFAHPLLRSAVYSEMSTTERAEAHAQAARMLAEGHEGAPRVAEHLLATAVAGDAWVVEQLTAAAREAAAAGAPESAAAYLRRALAEPPPPEAKAGLLRELGLAEFNAGQAAWREHLGEAVEAATKDSARIAAALLFATALGYHLRLAEAVKVCDRVAASLEGREPQARLMLETLAIAIGTRDADIAPSLAERARSLIEQTREQSVPRHTLAAAAYVAALANEPAERASELAHRALSADPRLLPQPGEPPWFNLATIGLFWAEQYDEAQVLIDAAVAEARAAANALVLPTMLAHRAWLAFRRGDLTAAEADARALLEAPGVSVLPLYRLLATAVLVEALVERGEIDEAERQLGPVATDLQSTLQTAALLRHSRGRLRFGQRRFHESLSDFRAAGDIATRTLALSPTFMPWRSDAALAQLALGDSDGARRLSEEELELARAFGAPRALGVALRAAGLVAGGESGEDMLREAIEVLAGPDTRLEHARALTDLGALLRRSNRRVEAREMLRQAVDAAYRIGAEPLASRAETELRATGAKPRRVMLTGLEALTASERRIAELAAEGLTNPQIAQTLFVTARTVESHLTHVFQKLDVTARTELPAALAAPTQAVPT
jgi:DNA-binding CsgD family transcriptional regulator/tetratricopeptide (TPR) repeat protein